MAALASTLLLSSCKRHHHLQTLAYKQTTTSQENLCHNSQQNKRAVKDQWIQQVRPDVLHFHLYSYDSLMREVR